MRTLIINDDSPQAEKFLEYARTLPFVKESVPERIPGVPCTKEELVEDINRSREDIKAGRVISHKELKKQMAAW